MKMHTWHVVRSGMVAVAISICATAALGAAPPQVQVEDPYLFTDESATVIFLDQPDGEITYTLDVLTPTGWLPHAQSVTGRIENKRLTVRPLQEGIQVLRFDGQREARFLAFDPPTEPIDPAKLAQALPRNASKLLHGEPFAIFAMGDSVTATGEYPAILAKLLRRATGNRQITVEKRAYSGRSIDATVRTFDDDVPLQKQIDLALLMYGLNDQAASAGLDVFLDQVRWVHDHVRRHGADLVLLQPTPHIDAKAMETEPAYPLRTIGYAEALRPLAAGFKVPLAETFNALWDGSHRSVIEATTAMWPLFPRSYSKQFTSMLESSGVGDTIHPNALGHLQLARAVYDAIVGRQNREWLPSISGSTRWSNGQMLTRLQVRNPTERPWSGAIDLLPPQGTRLEGDLQTSLNLPPGASRELKIRWPDLHAIEDIAKPPYDAMFVRYMPHVNALVTCGGHTRATAVFVPTSDGLHFRRGRWTVAANQADDGVEVVEAPGAVSQTVVVPLSGDADAVYSPLVKEINGQLIAADAYGVRYAAAVRGDVTADGDLTEWGDSTWSAVLLTQKSKIGAADDKSQKLPAPFRLRFAVRAGEAAAHVAFKADASAERDGFALFFDPRESAALGTVGSYYWIDGELQPDGKVRMRKGETSPKSLNAKELQGAWRREGSGEIHVELTLPYGVFRSDHWPTGGDLGFAVVWDHKLDGADKPVVRRYFWSDNAHWWTPVGYGVVRLRQDPETATMPWLVRVR